MVIFSSDVSKGRGSTWNNVGYDALPSLAYTFESAEGFGWQQRKDVKELSVFG